MKIPGVVGVGFGYKEKDGQFIDQLGWRIYVQEKKRVEDLRPEEVVPGSFGGFPTDVVRVPEVKPFAECEDSNSYSPLVCGATISNLVADDLKNVEVGTLGFFATLNSVTDAKENVVLVSAHHVLAANGAGTTAEIYQPYREDVAGESHIKENSDHPHEKLGQIHVFGTEGNMFYNYGDGEQEYFVDVASAKLRLSISSFCGTQCGIKFRPQLRPTLCERPTDIAGYERVSKADLLAHPLTDPYTVSKIGSRTGYTEGWVVDCEASFVKGGQTYTNVIYIVSLEKNCRGDFAFADQGDSGAAILNKDRKIVGIVQGGPADLSATYGCHIHPVISLLDVTPITAATPHSYATTLGDAEANWLGDRLSALKQSFLGSTQGRLLYGLVEQHRWEVSELVNKCRPVTLAWHPTKDPPSSTASWRTAATPKSSSPNRSRGWTCPSFAKRCFPC